MSSSTQLNLQHERMNQPVVAGLVVLAAIAAGIIVFNRFVAAEATRNASSVSLSSYGASAASTKGAGSNSLDINLNSSSVTSSDSANNQSSTSLTVNGESVPVEQSGSFQKSFVSDDGHSTVNISIDNHSSTEGGQ